MFVIFVTLRDDFDREVLVCDSSNQMRKMKLIRCVSLVEGFFCYLFIIIIFSFYFILFCFLFFSVQSPEKNSFWSSSQTESSSSRFSCCKF